MAKTTRTAGPVIAVHGGCGRWTDADAERALRSLRAAAQIGRRMLEDGASALDAVCASVVHLEDDPLFNAGTGSVLNSDGEAEMDASVMVGRQFACGGVAALRRVKNPVLVARRVMEITPHALLAGEGALAFARRCGFEDYDPVVPARRRGAARGGTVGAVALDARGVFAAATSTGGTSMKLAGRIGDSPIPGAGNYANPGAAASATGTGELMMRFLAAKDVCDRISAGESAADAVQSVVEKLPVGSGQSAALIAVGPSGRPGFFARGGRLPHAWHCAGEARVHAAVVP